MKIRSMLLREDFYRINNDTLTKYFSSHDSSKTKVLYVYSHLNAIVTRCPAKAVKRFLYTEYQISGTLWRKIAVWIYTRIALNSFGLLSSKRIRLSGSEFISNSKLIYPCNRKYRIFDFSSGIVDVVLKAGFPDATIRREIEFRTKKIPEFIPPLIYYNLTGYSEYIIDGVPLIRIHEGREKYCDEAMRIWRAFTDQFDKNIKVNEYIKIIQERLDEKVNELKKGCMRDDLSDCIMTLAKVSTSFEDSMITVTKSHGDMQQGNLWVENRTNKIYIIDWESYGWRIKSYDNATFWGGIRNPHGMVNFIRNYDILEYEKYIICLEDILYHIDEMMSLPDNFGVSSFNEYIKEVKQCLSL